MRPSYGYETSLGVDGNAQAISVGFFEQLQACIWDLLQGTYLATGLGVAIFLPRLRRNIYIFILSVWQESHLYGRYTCKRAPDEGLECFISVLLKRLRCRAVEVRDKAL